MQYISSHRGSKIFIEVSIYTEHIYMFLRVEKMNTNIIISSCVITGKEVRIL